MIPPLHLLLELIILLWENMYFLKLQFELQFCILFATANQIQELN